MLVRLVDQPFTCMHLFIQHWLQRVVVLQRSSDAPIMAMRGGEVMRWLLDIDAAILAMFARRSDCLERLTSMGFPYTAMSDREVSRYGTPDARVMRNTFMMRHVQEEFQHDEELAASMFPDEVDKMVEEAIAGHHGDHVIMAIRRLLLEILEGGDLPADLPAGFQNGDQAILEECSECGHPE